MEFPKKCEYRYRDCIDFDKCEVMCRGGEEKHPYCKFVSYCKLLNSQYQGFCDGRCEYNKRIFDIKKLTEKICEFGEAKRIIEKEINELKQKIETLEKENKEYKENHKNDQIEFFDYEREEDDQD